MIDSTSSAGTSAANALPTELSKHTTNRGGNHRDHLSTEKADQLRAALAGQPEVRPEMVARGKALAADASYPSHEVMNKVAGMILNSPDLSEDES